MKRFVLFLLISVVMLFGITGCTVDEPCDWCGNTPSVAYKTSDESMSYVCKKCSKTCMICGKNKATKHTENLLGMMMFVCDDCYDD